MMKKIILFGAVLFIAAAYTACKLDNINPDQTGSQTVTGTIPQGKSDTSKTLIANTALVGNWNIVTDSVSLRTDSMYRGEPGDHYTFTKYGNIYINNRFHQQIDTGIYTVSSDTQKVQWIDSYWTEEGAVSRSALSVGAFKISNLTSHSLVLTLSGITPAGVEFEQVTLSK
ncbi:MAG: hypothetical protein ACXVAU_04650 [Mucilaginibacter sp.]